MNINKSKGLRPFIIILILVSNGFACFGKDTSQWVNTLSPSGIKNKPITLAEAGTSNYVIVVPDKANSVERKAADDLGYWLSVLTGADFQIIKDISINNTKANYISVGETIILEESGLKDKYQFPGDNGYAIAVNGNNVFIWGPKYRGVINGVYALLEEDIGCRWYTRNAIKIPRLDRLTVSLVNRSYTPVLKQRLPFYKDAFDINWALRNRTSRDQPIEWGGSYGAIYGVHTLPRLLPEQTYFIKHPEYFSEINGQRKPTQICLTNLHAATIVADNIKAILRKNPAIKIVSVSLRDGKGYCCCKKCLELDTKNGYDPSRPDRNRSGSLIYFVNNVAQQIEKEFPDVLISTLAYLGTADAPTNIKPRSNVAIRICNDLHSWKYPLVDFTNYDKPESRRFKNIVKEWSDICNNIFIWDYTTNFTDYLWPLGNMNRIEPMVKYYLNHNVKGIMFQGNYTSFGGSRVPLRSWVLAKYLWDPSRNVQTLVKDFATGMYGKSADDILEYYEMLDQIGLDYQQGINNKDNMLSGLGIDNSFVIKALDIFKKAENHADNPVILQRVQLEKLPVLYLAAHFQNDCLQKSQISEIIDELEEICDRENITSFSEGSKDIQSKLNYFRNKLEFDSKGIKYNNLGEWFKFKADSSSKDIGKICHWTNKDFDDSKWQTISGWKTWDEQGYPFFAGTGWYRKHFKLPTEWPQNNEVFLLIGGIDEQAIIYLNGHKVHEHTRKEKKVKLSDLYKMKFIFPIGQYLDRKKDNILVLEVKNDVGAGGIYAPIFLISCDRPINPDVLWEFVSNTK